MTLTWKDAGEIGIQLYEKFPDLEPLQVRFTDLRQWALALDGFADDPAKSNEKILEAIQMSWYDEWQEDHA